MSALPLRRAPFLIAALALALAACGGKQGKPGVSPGLDDANPEAGQAPGAVEPANRCTADQLITPCQGGDGGSECSPYEGQRFTPPGGTMHPPTLTWSYPCVPDKFHVELIGPGLYQELAAEITAEPGATGLTFAWQPPNVILNSGSWYEYVVNAYESGVWSWYGTTRIWIGELCAEDPSDYEYLSWGFWNSCPIPTYSYITQQPSTFGWPRDALPGYGWVGCDFPSFEWKSYGYLGCLMTFEGQVSEDPNFGTNVVPLVIDPQWNTRGAYIATGPVEWCHTYYWRVRPRTSGGTGDWTNTTEFTILPPAGETQCVPRRTAHVGVEVSVAKNAACRIGPGTIYGIATYAAAGEKHPVDGRNADGTWFRLADLNCYVAASLLQEVPDVDVVPDPPLPTATTAKEPKGPTCDPGATTKAACEAGGGEWVSSFGYKCVCK